MTEAMLDALASAFSWPAILLPFVGALLGFVVGAMPGLGPGAGVALLIPVTFGWPPEHAFLLIASMIGGTTFGGSVTAILINTPGEGANAATMIDGYPMAKNGEASKAIAISATASALGAVFGLIVFVSLLPLSRELILRISYPETFMIAIVGLFTIALVSRGSMLKGLVAGGLGFMLSFVGRDLLTGNLRYTFGSLHLEDGIDFIAVLIGLFAISEAISLLVEGKQAPRNGAKLRTDAHWRQVRQGVGFTVRQPRLLGQSSTIGVITGMIPGVGGSVASFMSYAAAKQSVRDPQGFGAGDPRGVLASEASNDAKDGGALVPTIAFGLPGSPVWAVVLGAFLIHGITPGREMLTSELNIVFLIILGLLLANILVSLLGIAASPLLAPIAKLPPVYVAPVVFVIALVGSYSIGLRMVDVVVALTCGILGYILRRNGFSLIPIVIGMVLGNIVEQSLGQTLLTLGGSAFFTRPITLTVLFIGVVLFALPIVQERRSRRAKEEVSSDDRQRR